MRSERWAGLAVVEQHTDTGMGQSFLVEDWSLDPRIKVI